MVRYALEFIRGDAGRPHWLGFSEAQWTAFLSNVTMLGIAFFLPGAYWVFGLVAVVLIGAHMAVISIARRSANPQLAFLRRPENQRELLQTARESYRANLQRTREAAPLVSCTTSWGLAIIGQRIHRQDDSLMRYSVSLKGEWISLELVREIGRSLQVLRQRDREMHILEGEEGIFHFEFEPSKS